MDDLRKRFDMMSFKEIETEGEFSSVFTLTYGQVVLKLQVPSELYQKIDTYYYFHYLYF